jgi:hypothetical protein
MPTKPHLHILSTMTGSGPSLTVTFVTYDRGKLSVPYISVDGVEHAGDWGAQTQMDITPGDHHIEVYLRFKRVPGTHGRGKADFAVADGDVSVRAYFGPWLTTTEVNIPGQARIRRRRLPAPVLLKARRAPTVQPVITEADY